MLKSIKTVFLKDISAKKYYKYYTFYFIIVSILVYGVFLYNGKSFVFCDLDQGGDGLVQHYNSFVYYGRYLRSIIKTLLYEHKLVIPMWDMSIGYGQDIITTLSYYVIGDPFSALSVIIPTKFSEIGYSFLIWLRLYCAGLTFSAYCRYRGQRSYAPLVGSVVYTFSFYGLVSPILHPYFALPMIYLPLILIGVEKMFFENKKLFYTGMIALAAISNFYFFFMLCIITFLYIAIRYVEIYKKLKLKELIHWFIFFLLYSVIGMLMASVLLIPSIMNILGVSRVAVNNYVPVFYELDYYFKLLPAFINDAFEIENYYSFTGYTALGLLAIIVLIIKHKEKREYRFLMISFFALFFFLMFPFAGHVFNGFGYVTNRWIWGLSMLVSYILVLMMKEINNLNEKQWRIIFAIAIIYSLIILSFSSLRSEKNILSILELFGVIIIYYLMVNKKRYMAIANISMITVMLFINAYYCFSPEEGNYIENFTDFGNAYDLLTEETPVSVLKTINDDDIYRFDTAAISSGDLKRNSAMLLDQNGVAYYYSSTNKTVTKFNTELFMNYSMDQSYDNLDRRSILESLFGVRYVIIPKGYEQYLPFGYEKKVLTKQGYTVYKSDLSFPLGFTADSYIDKSTFDNLNVIQKQEALAQTVVVDKAISLEKADVSYSGIEIPYTIKTHKGIKYENGKLIVSQANASISIQFDEISNGELYFVFDNLSFESVSPFSFQLDDSDKTVSEKREMQREERNWMQPTGTTINATSGNISTTISYKTWKDNYYCGHNDFIGNLGYSENDRNKITLTFSETGVYSFDNLWVYYQPMDSLKKGYNEMSKESLKNISISDNILKGNISVESEKVLCVQIPYSSGWKVYVDGKREEILKVDEVFIGVLLSEGEHKVTFEYTTPTIKFGFILTILGCVIYAFMVIVAKNKRYLRN